MPNAFEQSARFDLERACDCMDPDKYDAASAVGRMSMEAACRAHLRDYIAKRNAYFFTDRSPLNEAHEFDDAMAFRLSLRCHLFADVMVQP